MGRNAYVPRVSVDPESYDFGLGFHGIDKVAAPTAAPQRRAAAVDSLQS